MSNYSELYSNLSESIENFITTVNSQKLEKLVTDKWTVKDELCHIVFWHRYYAQNYSALAKGEKPIVFTSKGGSTRNQEGVDSLKNKSRDELIDMLRIGQKELYESIVVKKVPEMNYTNRRKYKTEDFLDEIIRHINGHAKKILK